MGNLEVMTETTSKSEAVYNMLLNKIVDGSYAPGTLLSIREISQQAGVSRTPVKEAFSRLVYDGYIELLPNRSAIVARISTTEVLELLEVREALERSTAFYAAQRRTNADLEELQRINEIHRSIPHDQVAQLALWDKKFHMAIAKATYNQVLHSTLDKVFEKLTRISLPISRDRAADSIRQHQMIFDAIRARNPDEAQRMMSDHNRDVLASVKAYQYQNIHLFK
ncbi:MAG: GntR family transcriptional regulator [Faecousia sp.]